MGKSKSDCMFDNMKELLLVYFMFGHGIMALL